MRARRVGLWLVCLLLAVLANLAYSSSVPAFDAPSWARVVWFSLSGVLGLALVFSMPAVESRRHLWCYVIVPSLILRLVAMLTAPSDDVNRYLWEGKLVHAGESPYAETADSPKWMVYRDVYWQGMNHKDKATAYPPLALYGFAAVGAIDYSPQAMKWAFLLSDLLLVAGVLLLLKRRGMAPALAGLYAFSPVALVAFAGEGHFDVWLMAALIWALVAYESGRRQWAIVLIGLATGLKWVTAPLVPFFLRGSGRCGVMLLTGVLLVPALYFAVSIPELFQGLFAFGGTRSFNGLVYDSLHLGLGVPRTWANAIVMFLFGAIVSWRWFCGKRAPMELHLQWILGALILLSPTVHFWYLAWCLPLVCLRPTLAWISFSVSAAAYFFVWQNQANGFGWGLLWWQRVWFWGPFCLAAIYELWSTRGAVLKSGKSLPELAEPSVGVILPVHGSVPGLSEALESVAKQTMPVREVIIVSSQASDALSELEIHPNLSVRVVVAELGRGQQILAGIRACHSDWVLVLHADACLHTGSVEKLQNAAAADPTLIGGAMGQRFREQSLGLLVVEVLNDFRGLFTRTAFGDQVQFFRRDVTLSAGLMPAQPLMEDVEASWRIRAQGSYRYLMCPAQVSGDKWVAMGWSRRVRLVLRLVARYRWVRLRGQHAAGMLSRELYEEYYSKPSDAG